MPGQLDWHQLLAQILAATVQQRQPSTLPKLKPRSRLILHYGKHLLSRSIAGNPMSSETLSVTWHLAGVIDTTTWVTVVYSIPLFFAIHFLCRLTTIIVFFILVERGRCGGGKSEDLHMLYRVSYVLREIPWIQILCYVPHVAPQMTWSFLNLPFSWGNNTSESMSSVRYTICGSNLKRLATLFTCKKESSGWMEDGESS